MKHQDDITRIANCIYQSIGYDLQQARAEVGEPGDIDRETLIDVVMDQFEVHGIYECGASPELITYWQSLDYQDKVKALTVAFPYEVYE